MKRVIETAKEILISIKKKPLDIKLLLLFSTLMTLASTYIHLESNKDLYETIIPYTGWSPGYFFMFIVFIIIWSYTSKNKQRSKLSLLLRGYFILTFGVHLFRGISDWHNVLPEDFTNTNPYLRYDSLRPIYSIGLPLFWILIHTGSQLKDYFNNKKVQTGI